MCFRPVNIKNIYDKKNEFRFIQIEYIFCNIEKFKLHNLMRYMLLDFCEISIVGYKSNEDIFWCKKYNKTDCKMHVEIEIINKGYFTEIKIIPIFGKKVIIDDFIENFKECLNLYKNSSFIKFTLESNIFNI